MLFRNVLIDVNFTYVRICVVEPDVWGGRYDFLERGCGLYVLRQDEGLFEETWGRSSVHKRWIYIYM